MTARPASRQARTARTDRPAPTVLAAGSGWSDLAVKDAGNGDGGGRPPYRVPSMAEVEATEPNGLVVASTFSGAGGSCLGYRMAGFSVAWASEFEPHAADTYRANHPGTVLDTRDVRQVTGADIREAVGREVDLLDGSPPCQSFSTAGKRSRGWGVVAGHADGTVQRSDDLFFEYARILGELRPRTFVAENVSGLVKGVAKGYFKRILAALSAQGYQVRARVLDAQWLGVPQQRNRVIFVGARDDLGTVPSFPVPLPYRYSLGDACPWLASMHWDPRGQFTPADYGAGDTPQAITVGSTGQWRVVGRTGGWSGRGETGEEWSGDEPFPTVQAGGHMRAYVEDAGLEFHSGGWNDGKRRGTDEPSPSVQAGGLDGGSHSQVSVAGAGRRRRLTINELKRICSFPDDFVLDGPYEKQWARLGNSVPPLMMRAVAEVVRDTILLPR